MSPARVLGQVAALGDDQRYRLADMPHLVLGQRHLGALIEHDVLDRGRRDQKRSGAPIIAEVGRGVDRRHAFAPARRRGVDPQDARVGVRAAHERGVQHPRQLDVVDEQRLAGEQTAVLVPRYPLADIPRHHPSPFPVEHVLVAGPAVDHRRRCSAPRLHLGASRRGRGLVERAVVVIADQHHAVVLARRRQATPCRRSRRAAPARPRARADRPSRRRRSSPRARPVL